MPDFIDSLNLSSVDKFKLRSLGTGSAPALLALFYSAPQEVNAFIGAATVSQVKAKLEASLTPEERNIVSNAQPTFFLGAITSHPAPMLKPTNFNIDERDRLYDRYHALKDAKKLSPREQLEIVELEEKLNAMLQVAE